MTLPSIEVRGGASCRITRGPGMEIVKSLQHLVFFFFIATDMVMGHIGVRLCHVVWRRCINTFGNQPLCCEQADWC